MNLDKKLELAEKVLIAIVQADNRNYNWDAEGVSALSFEVADAMEVEYNKRKQAESEQNAKQSKILFEQLTKNKDGSCAHFHTTLNKAECFDCGSKLNDEFQPDWSVAPEWANYWIKTSGKSYAWLGDKPEISEIIPHWNIECIQKTFAPSFDYQGDWKDSLRKRP